MALLSSQDLTSPVDEPSVDVELLGVVRSSREVVHARVGPNSAEVDPEKATWLLPQPVLLWRLVSLTCGYDHAKRALSFVPLQDQSRFVHRLTTSCLAACCHR